MYEIIGSILFLAYIGFCIYAAFEAIFKFLGNLFKEATKPPKVVTPPPPNPNPYTLEELQNHLNNYYRKALQSGSRDKWKYGRDYERYIGYLWEKNGWKVIYNGAVEGNFDGGIDLICYKDNECRLIQCKRWKNNVSAEYIEKFNDAVERFQRYNFKYGNVRGVFCTTSDYTDDAYSYAKKYEIERYIIDFKSIREYPPVKCLISKGEKVYYLPFDKEFDRISVEKGCDYKFTVTDAEKAGYHYHLNRDVLLKVNRPAPRPKTQPFPMVNHYWKGDKNYPVGYFHAGYFEFVDLKSCRILKIYTDTEIEGEAYILQTKYICLSLSQAKNYKENIRVFRYFKDFPILPEVYEDNHWEFIPNYRTLKAGESYLSYIENQRMYAYTMFKIVYHELFGKEYADGCKHGWHYEKGYPEYR